jgi:hypothetical protein
MVGGINVPRHTGRRSAVVPGPGRLHAWVLAGRARPRTSMRLDGPHARSGSLLAQASSGQKPHPPQHPGVVRVTGGLQRWRIRRWRCGRGKRSRRHLAPSYQGPRHQWNLWGDHEPCDSRLCCLGRSLIRQRNERGRLVDRRPRHGDMVVRSASAETTRNASIATASSRTRLSSQSGQSPTTCGGSAIPPSEALSHLREHREVFVDLILGHLETNASIRPVFTRM